MVSTKHHLDSTSSQNAPKKKKQKAKEAESTTTSPQSPVLVKRGTKPVSFIFPRSGYLFFRIAAKKALNKKGTNPAENIANTINDQWRAISAVDKARFQILAEQDKPRAEAHNAAIIAVDHEGSQRCNEKMKEFEQEADRIYRDITGRGDKKTGIEMDEGDNQLRVPETASYVSTTLQKADVLDDHSSASVVPMKKPPGPSEVPLDPNAPVKIADAEPQEDAQWDIADAQK